MLPPRILGVLVREALDGGTDAVKEKGPAEGEREEDYEERDGFGWDHVPLGRCE